MKQTMSPLSIKSLRQQAGLTQQQAADLVCINIRSWQRYEEGSRTPHPSIIELFKMKTKQ